MQFFLMIFRRENTFFPIRDAKKKHICEFVFCLLKISLFRRKRQRNPVSAGLFGTTNRPLAVVIFGCVVPHGGVVLLLLWAKDNSLSKIEGKLSRPAQCAVAVNSVRTRVSVSRMTGRLSVEQPSKNNFTKCLEH